MIDLHTHALPAMDDGAPDLAAGVAMLSALEAAGVTDVVLTPHHGPLRGFVYDASRASQALHELEDSAKEAGLTLTLHAGSEIDASRDILTRIHAATPLKKTRHVLIDFGMEGADIEECVYECGLGGYTVVIAHAERYHSVSLERLSALRAQGAYVQVNAKHLIKSGSPVSCKRARKMLKHGLIDVVASDSHDTLGAGHMRKARAYVVKKYGQKRADALFYDNPAKVLNLER